MALEERLSKARKWGQLPPSHCTPKARCNDKRMRSKQQKAYQHIGGCSTSNHFQLEASLRKESVVVK